MRDRTSSRLRRLCPRTRTVFQLFLLMVPVFLVVGIDVWAALSDLKTQPVLFQDKRPPEIPKMARNDDKTIEKMRSMQEKDAPRCRSDKLTRGGRAPSPGRPRPPVNAAAFGPFTSLSTLKRR